MNKKIISKILMFAFLAGFIVQAGVTAYSMIGTNSRNISTNTVKQEDIQENTIVEASKIEEGASTDISLEIQNVIRESDPNNYNRNIQNYKDLLIGLNVHGKHKEDIEELLLSGYRLPDIMIAYEYLYHSYGTMENLKTFILQRSKNMDWKTIFSQYKQNDTPFIPRSYHSDYLEKLMETPGLTSDDIMIADRISYEASKDIDELLNKRMEGNSWRTINAEVNILNSSDIIPRVQVTSEDIQKYSNGSFTDQQIIEAFVLAEKLKHNSEEIINKMKAGHTEEAIQKEIYEAKYY